MMVEINHKIIITGILSLAAISITLILCNHDTPLTTNLILAIIGIAIGVVIPVPTINNKTGVLKW